MPALHWEKTVVHICLIPLSPTRRLPDMTIRVTTVGVLYRMAGYFRGVLIFAYFSGPSKNAKINTAKLTF